MAFTREIKKDEYVVQKGDSLSSIAQKKLGQGSRYTEIIALNNLKNPYILEPGQIIKLPTVQPSKTEQDESVRADVKSIINRLIPPDLDKRYITYNAKMEKAVEIYVQLLQQISWLEGICTHIYPDAKGIPTIGLGFNVSDDEQLKKLKFLENGSVVTNFKLVQKARDFVKEQAQKDIRSKGVVQRPQDYLGKENNLLISEKQAIDVSVEHLKGDVVKNINTTFHALSTSHNGMPPPIAVLVGLIDKVYNAGMHKLKQDFPKFLQAIREGNYITAAQESANRPRPNQGGIIKRNTLIYELLIKDH